MISQISYLSVGEHRDNRRIWMEGKRLAACGFDRGQAYAVILDVSRRCLTLEACEGGDRVVSGRQDASSGTVQPIIELSNADITRHLETCMGNPSRVRVTLEVGTITVTLQEIEANRQIREARVTERARERRISEGVVCAGGGISAWALALGLEDRGYTATCEWILDRDGRYLESAIRNVPVVTPGTRIFEATVEEIEPTLLPPIDILSVSLPCVGFSKSGISKKHLEFPEEDASGTAFLGLLGIIRCTNPSVIVHENVPAFQGSVTCHLMTRFLETLGYAVGSRILGRELGAFERRERHILLAVSRGLSPKVDMDRIEPSMTAPRRLADFLEEIPDDSPRWKRFDYLGAKEDRDIAQGKGFRRQVLGADAPSCGTIGRGYHKARSTEPFVAHPKDPRLSRLLTPAEHAAAKGVPARAVAGLSETTAHEILGQSVLFPVFRSIGQLLGRDFEALASEGNTSSAPRPPAAFPLSLF